MPMDRVTELVLDSESVLIPTKLRTPVFSCVTLMIRWVVPMW